MSRRMRKPTICICENKSADVFSRTASVLNKPRTTRGSLTYFELWHSDGPGTVQMMTVLPWPVGRG